MTDQYEINENNRRDYVAILEGAIPLNLEKGDFATAAANYGGLAQTHTDLGLLHWRRGLDPRADFARAITACDSMSRIAKQRELDKNIFAMPSVYAMLALMGHQSVIEFEDEAYHDDHRWPCYECCVVHALHDQPLNEHHSLLLEHYLMENDAPADRAARTYLQLLGIQPSDQLLADLVATAEANWVNRKRDKFFADGPAFFGYGVMNDIYVDIYLAAILSKIGWDGASIHCLPGR